MSVCVCACGWVVVGCKNKPLCKKFFLDGLYGRHLKESQNILYHLSHRQGMEICFPLLVDDDFHRKFVSKHKVTFFFAGESELN